MARKTTRRHTQGEVSRRAILDATLRIAGRRGYVGTTMAQVTRASGLPASSVYWHFGNKDELLAEALDHGLARWDTAVAPWSEVETGPSRQDQLLSRLRAVIRTADLEPGLWRMGLLIALETGPQVGSAPRQRFAAVRQRSLMRLSDWWSHSLTAEHQELQESSAPVEERARTMALLTLVTLDGLFVARQSNPEDDLDPAMRLAAVGLDVAAQRLMTDSTGHRPTTVPAPPQIDRDTDSSRTRLLEAAAVVAAESGYDGASISRICERAGLPASSLYWHFKNKDDLLAAVIEHSYEAWFQSQPAWPPLQSGTSWQEALRDHFSVTLRSLADRPLFLRMGHLLLLLDRENPPAARTRFVAVRREARLVTRAWYTEALVPDADPELPDSMALMTMVLSDGLFFSNQVDVPTWDIDLFADLVVTMLAAGSASPRMTSSRSSGPDL